MPAVLPENGWWSLWGEIALLNPRPEILVYAHEATFQLWSGVLEIGGYDVIEEPFAEEKLQDAVNRAAHSFEERRSGSMSDERGAEAMFRKIVVAYNESPESQRAFVSAIKLAKSLDAELLAVTAMARSSRVYRLCRGCR